MAKKATKSYFWNGSQDHQRNHVKDAQGNPEVIKIGQEVVPTEGEIRAFGDLLLDSTSKAAAQEQINLAAQLDATAANAAALEQQNDALAKRVKQLEDEAKKGK